MAVTDGLCEPVTCASCGAVSVNGDTLHCHRCYTDAQAENAKLRAVVDNLNIMEIAACEAFAEGVRTGEPTQEQIDALMDAGGAIRALLQDHDVRCPYGQGRATVTYLRELANRCEHEAAEAAKETDDG